MESKPLAPSMPGVEEILPGRAEPVLEPGISHAVNGRPLLPPYPDHLDVANFAMGCFWGAEKGFWSIPGVWVTAVGYQGGTTPNPTYQEVRSGRTGHAEVVRVVFDPAVVSYEQLLRIFWESHDPTQGFRQGHDLGTQYRSAIYTYSPTQLETALTSRDLYQPVLTEAGFGAITTEIGPAPRLYFAEAYHQQYLVKVPDGYCPDHGTGIACPIGVAVKAE